jgi:hypothetical protein
MCFGNTTTNTTTNTPTPNANVAAGANQNLGFAENLQNQGFTPYGGQMVAPFSGQQQSSFGMANNEASSPLVGQATGLVSDVGGANAQSVSAPTISSMMSPYMSQYVQQSLAPQLENLQQQYAGQNRQAAANDTMAGAFGNDAQDAIYRSNLTNQQNIGLSGLVGNAYNSAFNTAIGAGAQDVSNSLNAQTTNANLANTQLQNKLSAAGGLQNIIGTQTGLTGLQNTMGQQQTAQSQAGLNAAYNQYLMQMQYPFQTGQLLNQTVGAASQAMPASTVSTTQQPNNAGWALAGALGPSLFNGGNQGFSGSALGSLMFMEKGGELPAGQPAVVGEAGPEEFKAKDGGKPHLIGKQGPEVIVPKKTGEVVPHDELEKKRAKKPKKSSMEDAFGVAA